jgi:hypothetical protein
MCVCANIYIYREREREGQGERERESSREAGKAQAAMLTGISAYEDTFIGV